LQLPGAVFFCFWLYIRDNTQMEKKKADRMIGILGGMGPEATLDLYRNIIQLTPAIRDQDHIRVMIYSNPKIPDRTRAIIAGGESPLPYLVESARLLERSGAGILAIPCNTSHRFLPDIQREIRIPILNMVEATCKALHSRIPNAKKVGLLAATGTLGSQIYEKAFLGTGIQVLAPKEDDQEKVQDAIAKIKAGVHDSSSKNVFLTAGLRLVRAGAQAVILGCTEIPLVFSPGDVDYPTLNSTWILAKAAVDWALGKE
jgi:aspartate racemase